MATEESVLEELKALCSSPGYVHIVAWFVQRDDTVNFDSDGGMTAEAYSSAFTTERLVRKEISVLLNLVGQAQVIDDTLPTQAQTQAAIEETERLLSNLHDALAEPMRLSAQAIAEGKENEDLGNIMREPIMYNGETAFSFQYYDLSIARYSHDNIWLQEHVGFPIEQAVRVFQEISSIVEENMQATFVSFLQKPPELWTWLPAFEFTVEALAERTSIESEVIKKIVDRFTLTPEKSRVEYRSVTDYNAYTSSPIIQTASGKLLRFQDLSLAEAVYESPFHWFLSDNSYIDAANKNRGNFTEGFAASCFRRVFLPTQVHLNVDVFKDGQRDPFAEIDTLILHGTKAIVVQAKSKKLTLKARAGDETQLRKDFQEAVQSPYEQALKCAEAITTPGFSFSVRGANLNIDTPIDEVHIICLLSEHYPALNFQVHQFLRPTVIEKTLPPHVLDVFALDSLTEFLSSPLRLFQYLSLRAQSRDQFFAAHEYIILAFHLHMGLRPLPEVDVMQLGDDIAASLDIAMLVRRTGLAGARTPDGILTWIADTRLGRLVDSISFEADPMAMAIGLSIVNLSQKSQLLLATMFERCVADAARFSVSRDFTLMTEDRSVGVTVHCNELDELQAKRNLVSYCLVRKYRERAGRWSGICVDSRARFKFGFYTAGEFERSDQLDVLAREMKDGVSVEGISLAKRKKIGRNELCPCGSGRKYKKCHLR